MTEIGLLNKVTGVSQSVNIFDPFYKNWATFYSEHLVTLNLGVMPL